LAAQGLQGTFGAQGLAAWQGFVAAQGLAAAQGFAAAQGLQGLTGFLTAAAQGLAGAQAAICTEVSAAWAAASGSAAAPAETVATLSATRVFFSMLLASNRVRSVGAPPGKRSSFVGGAPPCGQPEPKRHNEAARRSLSNHAPAIGFNFL
jgi:hypothetical protein